MEIEEYKMRILYEMDKKDYVPNGSVFSRPSARAIIIKNGKIAMQKRATAPQFQAKVGEYHLHRQGAFQ